MGKHKMDIFKDKYNTIDPYDRHIFEKCPSMLPKFGRPRDYWINKNLANKLYHYLLILDILLLLHKNFKFKICFIDKEFKEKE